MRSIAMALVLDFDEIEKVDPETTPGDAIRALARVVCAVASATAPTLFGTPSDICSWSGFAWIPIDGMHGYDELLETMKRKHNTPERIADIAAKWAAAGRPIAVIHTLPLIDDKDRLN